MTSSPQVDNERPAQGGGARASDADRIAVVAVLHDAVARGLLTLDEGDERVAAAYAARFLTDLPPLTADLPPAPAPAPTAPGWHALAVLVWLQVRAAVAGFSWRGSARAMRARPRLALVLVALLALLSVGAITAGGADDRGPGFGDHWPRIEQGEHFGPR
jgi:hypothetical protein